jgi:hypothetical protein
MRQRQQRGRGLRRRALGRRQAWQQQQGQRLPRLRLPRLVRGPPLARGAAPRRCCPRQRRLLAWRSVALPARGRLEGLERQGMAAAAAARL